MCLGAHGWQKLKIMGSDQDLANDQGMDDHDQATRLVGTGKESALCGGEGAGTDRDDAASALPRH